MDTELIRRLLITPSPSGKEHEVLRYLAEILGVIAGAELTLSQEGLLFRNSHRYKPIVYVLCHVDEVALEVTAIDDKQRFFIQAIGNIPVSALLGSSVAFCGGKIIGLVLPADENQLYDKNIRCQRLYVETGKNDEHFKNGNIGEGSIGNIVSNPKISNDRILGKGLDNKLGVAILVEYLRKHSFSAIYSLNVLFTCKEEVKLSTFPEELKQADQIVVIDAASTVEKPCLGEGVIVNYTPNRPNPYLSKLIETMNAQGIKYQEDTIVNRSGTEADVIFSASSFELTPITVLSYPVSFLHTPFELAYRTDIDATFSALKLLLSLSPDVNSGCDISRYR